MTAVPGEWAERGACRGSDANFFPTQEFKGGASLRMRREIAEAKAVCARCPVKDECLAHALRNEEPDGIWGGLTREGRKRLRLGQVVSTRKPINHGTAGGYIAHRRRKEEPCKWCVSAHATYQRINRAARRRAS